jgi:hypothetical protein
MAGLPIEMFLVRPAVDDDSGCLDQISDLVERLDGLVLMATGGGGVVVGLPAGRKDLLAASPAVAFVGGVSFAEDAPGLAALRQKFALNAARQLAARGRSWMGEPQRPDGPRQETPAWSERLVDPRTLLASADDAGTAPPPPTATKGDRR